MAVKGRGAAVAVIMLGLAVLGSGCGGPAEESPRFAAQWTRFSRAGPIDHPEGLAIDAQGKLLIADTWNNRILRVDGDRVLLAFGGKGTKPGQLWCPRSVATDKRGNLYVVDNWNQRVQKFSPEGRFLLKFGEKGAPKGYDEAPGKWVYPYGVAVDSQGFIYVSDFNNNRVQKFDPNGKFVMMWGTEGRQDGQFSHPAGLAVDKQDRLYVADLGNDRIQAFRPNGKKMQFDGKWGESGEDPGQFDRPYAVSVDEQGNVYAVDLGNHRIQKFSPRGRLMFAAGKWGSGEGELDCPIAITVGPDRAIYISDLGNNRIQKWTPAS
jgi:sugar lactone lactonase YvrE